MHEKGFLKASKIINILKANRHKRNKDAIEYIKTLPDIQIYSYMNNLHYHDNEKIMELKMEYPHLFF